MVMVVIMLVVNITKYQHIYHRVNLKIATIVNILISIIDNSSKTLIIIFIITIKTIRMLLIRIQIRKI